MIEENGIGGTDGGKIVPLFPDEASAAGLPPQEGVISILENLLEKAILGEIVGLIYVGLDSRGNYTNGTRGRVVYTASICALEELKFNIIHSNAKMLQVPSK